MEGIQLDDLVTFGDDELAAFASEQGLLLSEGVEEGILAVEEGGCWGPQLVGGPLPGCNMSFVVSGVHLKDKICSSCRLGVRIPASRVRAIGGDLDSYFSNTSSEGLWNSGGALGLPDFRLINHTKGCSAPRLVVFRTPLPIDDLSLRLPWIALPSAWLQQDECVCLWAAKGTFVPTRPRKLFQRASGSGASLPASKRQHASLAAAESVSVARLSALVQPCNTALQAAWHLPGAFEEGSHSGLSLTGSFPEQCISLTGNRSPEPTCGHAGKRSVDECGSHSVFVTRFVAAHSDLRNLIEERLCSIEPLLPQQRSALMEQLRFSSSIILRAVDGTGLAGWRTFALPFDGATTLQPLPSADILKLAHELNRAKLLQI